MIIKGNVSGIIYKKLIEHLLKKCDVISVGKYPSDIIKSKTIDVIKKEENCSIVDIIKNYLEDEYYLEKIMQKYKENEKIFDANLVLREENVMKYNSNLSLNEKKTILYDLRKNYIKSEIEWLVYDYKTNKWLQEYDKNIIYVMNERSYSTYYLKLDNDLRQEILNRKSLYDWDFPLSVLDIAFFDNGSCLFCSEIHEKMCDLYCSDEKEFNYFKSIGIEFYDLKYIKDGKHGLPYVNYFKEKNYKEKI